MDFDAFTFHQVGSERLFQWRSPEGAWPSVGTASMLAAAGCAAGAGATPTPSRTVRMFGGSLLPLSKTAHCEGGSDEIASPTGVSSSETAGVGGGVESALTSAVLCALGGFSRLVMNGFNTTTYLNRDKFVNLLEGRRHGQGVVTVCNHVSAVDDPGAVAVLVPWNYLIQPDKVRWTLCAKDRCFNNPVVAAFLRKGKVLPVERGRGIFQPYMDDVVKKLNLGQWVHMFPEGTRTFDGTIGKMRTGVARLIAEPAIPPLVVPFYHSGMQTIMSRGDKVPVAFGQKLTILVGDPINFDDLLAQYKANEITQKQLHEAITARTETTLKRLQKQVETFHEMRPDLAPPKDSWNRGLEAHGRRKAERAAKVSK